MDAISILPILKQIPVFANLNEAQHQGIIKDIVLNYYPVGHVFFREKDAVDDNSCMYIIKHGLVKISRTEGVVEKEVAILSDNAFFGEMAFVFNEPRNASATVIADAEVFELKKARFLELMQNDPDGAAKISQEFIARVKQNEQK